MRYILYILAVMFICACSTSTDSISENYFKLPKKYPLKAGSVWVYKNTYFNPERNHIWIDSLRVIGKHGDWFKASLHPNYGYELVSSDDNKLMFFGYVINYNNPDTTIFEQPIIKTFFNIDTGLVNLTKYENYSCISDSIHVSIVHGMEFLNKRYDVYVIKFYRKEPLYSFNEHVISVDGIMRERVYYMNGQIASEKIILAKLENYDQNKALKQTE